MSKTLTSEALWFGGNSVLIVILSIILFSVLAFELRRTGLLMVLIKCFRISILHELLELPSDVGFHLGIFIIYRLISLVTFSSFPNSSQTQFIGLQFANQLRQMNFFNVLLFFNGSDLGMESLRQRSEYFSHNLGFRNLFSKNEGWVNYVFQLGIEFIKWLILCHLYLLKANSVPLELWILDSPSPFIDYLEDGTCFLSSFS